MAQTTKPGQPGTEEDLRIRRYFTTEGVHPYDEIEWEKRDAVIQNYRTGEVAFEQKDVEFPKAWSQNATNIVAQKYFRGSPNTPQRETSVKQMIDRVVDRYHEEGLQSGYFRDEDEADTFRAELAHLLVNQKAAFNSPVWFNVGWRPKGEEQVSACQPYGSLVSTPAGLVPIGKLVEDNAVGEKVFDGEGVTKIVAVKSNGTKSVLRIHTKAGYTLEVTADHLVWRRGPGKSGFVRADELAAGDGLEWHRRDSFGESEINARDIHDAAIAGADIDTSDPALPGELFAAPAPAIAAFLQQLFTLNADVVLDEGDAEISLASPSEDLVRGIQQLLLRFGVFASVSFEEEAHQSSWFVRIRALADRRRFADGIGLIDKRKTEMLEESLRAEGMPESDVEELQIARIESLGPMEVYDIQTESGEYLSGNLRVHNCFILAVDDEMQSILNWYVEEGTIFKGGSGSGINLSTIRSSKERLKSGGTASGPVSFMRGADASAGTIKSGGATRRAAKMVVLNADHPDVRDFIWCKALEEQKARALREAGFDMDLDGKDSHSIQYQNANNSVRVTDEFMQAVLDDADWDLKAVTSGEAVETIKARELMREISDAAWQCADPGLQYDTTINDWHTAPNSGRINASNPCFPGDARVHTDKGLVRFENLIRRVMEGETFDVYTHEITNKESPTESITLSKPTQLMVTGVNEIVKLAFSDGRELRCTPNHRIWTENRGMVRADELTENDHVRVVNHESLASMAEYTLPVSTDRAMHAIKGDERLALGLPEKWTEEFAHYLGWLIGDGCISGDMVSTIYGSDADQDEALPRHSALLTEINGGVEPKPNIQGNGTVQLRVSRRPFRLLLEALGVKAVRGAAKRVPWSIFEAPDDIVAAFLRGLFDADGCAHEGRHSRYAGLGSKSKALLQDVQMLLSRFAVPAVIYGIDERPTAFDDARRPDDQELSYQSSEPGFALGISSDGLERFSTSLGFDLTTKPDSLESLVVAGKQASSSRPVVLRSRRHDGHELTYNLTEPRNHTYIVDGLVVANCSEYVHVDNSSCNLASLNLMKFVDDDGRFDIESFKHAVEVVFLAQEISVGFASYPTEKIGENSHRFRQLGQGYANLGALLMSQGLAYDSDAGRAWAGAITAIMTGHCYATSAKIAKRVGPFAAYMENAEPMVRVINKHREAAYEIPHDQAPNEMVEAARHSWDEALALGLKHGYRNAQASVLAPTGTIGLMMDCDTTGIEPDLALKKMKKLVGGGTMSIVNQTVPRALTNLGYDEQQVADIVAYIDENSHVVGAPHLREEHLDVFDTAMGERSIHYMGHIKMMAAAQPFLSGAISKTVNLPENVTIEDVEQVYIEGWRLGLKALALYRDNCKVAQPLASSKKEDRKAEKVEPATTEPVRRRLPKARRSMTFKFRVADTEGYLTAGEFPEGTVGEIFLRVAKQGSTLAGIMDAFAISISMGLQYGVPLSAYVKQFTNTRFEPSGMTDDADFRIATSILDYVFRRLALEYLGPEERHALGIRTSGERQGEIEAKLTPGDDAPKGKNGNGNGRSKEASGDGVIVLGPVAGAHTDSLPFCGTCGIQMQPAGSCFACSSCGATSGCS